MIIIGPLFLEVIGPGKLPGMARDFGRSVGRRRHVDEFKAELTSTENGCSSESQLDDRTGQRPELALSEA